MKLIIQIPCFNEEATLPETIRDLPRQVPGVDAVEFLVIDDGSSDRTSEVARSLGVHHVVRHVRNRGLAAAFQTGVDAALALGADVIVNTDADHQYPGGAIPSLVGPVLEGKADIVIGDRKVGGLRHLPWTHRLLQAWGSAVVRRISGTRVPDAPSGFRAFSREAALRFDILTEYTYTLETIIQAGRKGMEIVCIPIDVNAPTRESRLKKSQWQYVWRSAATILRLYALYQPLKTFLLLGLPFLLGGLGLWIRYLVLTLRSDAGRGAHIQSVVVGGALILIAVLLASLGMLGDILAKNRVLSERAVTLAKRALFARPPTRT